MSANRSLADIQREFYEEQAGQNPDPVDFIADSAAGIAGAAVSATLGAEAGKRTYITGFSVTVTNPAAAVSGEVTVTGIGGTTLRFKIVQPTTEGMVLQVNFPEPLPANANNTAIVVTLPAITGGGAGAVAAWGFRK